jgi:hypothetical protein
MTFAFHIVDALPKKHGSYLEFLSRHNIQTKFLVFPDETVYQMDVFFNLAEIIPLQSHPQVKEHVYEIHRYILSTIVQQNKPYSLMNVLGFKMYVYNNAEVSFENSTLIKSNCTDTLVHQIPISMLLNKSHQCFGKTFSFVDDLFHEAKLVSVPSLSVPSLSVPSQSQVWGSSNPFAQTTAPSLSVPSQTQVWGSNQSSNPFAPPSLSVPSLSVPSQAQVWGSNQSSNPFAQQQPPSPQTSPSPSPSPTPQQSTWGSNWNMYQQPRFG